MAKKRGGEFSEFFPVESLGYWLARNIITAYESTGIELEAKDATELLDKLAIRDEAAINAKAAEQLRRLRSGAVAIIKSYDRDGWLIAHPVTKEPTFNDAKARRRKSARG